MPSFRETTNSALGMSLIGVLDTVLENWYRVLSSRFLDAGD